jgi:hypothetical protein
MAKIDDGGPAFPHDKVHHNTQIGMSLRDYFAAQVLPEVLGGCARNIPEDKLAGVLASTCYGIADAMLAERARTNSTDS